MAKRNTKASVKKAKEAMLYKEEIKPPPPKDFLSIGSTVANLAISGMPFGAIPKGSYVLFVGDSNSGKTWFSMTLFAEASISKRFKKYRFIYDGGEYGAMMNLRHYFGDEVANKIEYPTENGPSEYAEEFFYNVHDKIEEGVPFIYVLDSMDSLDTKDDDTFFDEKKAAFQGGKAKESGSYGTSKARINSNYLRKLLKGLRRTGSILVIISQTRDNIGFGAKFNPRTRAGGRAMKFYATVELWTAQKGHVKKTVRKKARELGIYARIDSKKNRITGRDRTITVPIYHSHGIDDLGGCVNFLIEEGHWTGSEKTVTAPEFDFKGKVGALIRQIEKEGRETELRLIVADVWNEIEEACALKRKSPYRQDEEDEDVEQEEE
jgi:RecA/RadA recombinase